jgi:hypothetical protein
MRQPRRLDGSSARQRDSARPAAFVHGIEVSDIERRKARLWLEAVHEGDAAACYLMTAEYRRELAAEVNAGNTACRQAIESTGPAASDGLPSAYSEMDVPAWDPSGEALIEVTDDEQIVGFWMQFMEGRWLVAGKAN